MLCRSKGNVKIIYSIKIVSKRRRNSKEKIRRSKMWAVTERNWFGDASVDRKAFTPRHDKQYTGLCKKKEDANLTKNRQSNSLHDISLPEDGILFVFFNTSWLLRFGIELLQYRYKNSYILFSPQSNGWNTFWILRRTSYTWEYDMVGKHIGSDCFDHMFWRQIALTTLMTLCLIWRKKWHF